MLFICTKMGIFARIPVALRQQKPPVSMVYAEKAF
ncbi:hypothetical protein CBM2625_A240030 [Cupriavidus taiwanensis]|nr:hypothetical protein CBM2625_A240030 [Cupriavidus taiwanensis]